MKEVEDGCEEEFHFRNDYYMEGIGISNLMSFYFPIPVTSKGRRYKFGIESQHPVNEGRVLLGRLINHSRKHPNVFVVPHHKEVAGELTIKVAFVTKRPIKVAASRISS